MLERFKKVRCSIGTRDFGAKRRRWLLDAFLRARHHGDQETWSQLPDQVEINVDELMITLSDDLLFKILILLPAESLFRSQFVCKKWFGLINTSLFITCHNSQQSETVLICQKLTPALPKSYFHFLDLKNGGNRFIESSIVEIIDIRASYDGLILATIGKNRQSLMVMNPITRKHVVLPKLGVECDSRVVEALGIAFCNEAYKIVHAYGERSGRTSCGIFSICARKWTKIEGPPFELLQDMTQMSVTIGGSLYWLSKKLRHEYFVAMDLHCKKFVTKNLPISTTRTVHDRLIEVRGKLGFVTHDFGLDQLQVWILIMESGTRVNWMKKYSINTSVYYTTPKPICCSKSWEGIVLEIKNELYVFNFERGEMKLIQSISEDEVGFERAFNEYIPHRNTLASWEDHLEVQP